MKATVDYLFSKNNKIGSKFISWGTKHLSKELDTPSHIAVLINSRWVFESTLSTGIRVISYKNWLSINKEVEKIPCKQQTREYSEIKKVYKTIQDKKYDWPGIIYFGWRVFLNKYFKITIPKDNKLQSNDAYFCSEAIGMITGQGRYSMTAPVQLLEAFKNG